MKSKKYQSRKFLNSKYGLAAIEVNCNVCDWSMDVDVTLSDCNRNISLDFNVYREKDYNERIKKLSLIIDELLAVQSFMNDNKDSFFKARKELDLKNKAMRNVKPLPKPLSELLGELNDK